jgi:hypothetical protein
MVFPQEMARSSGPMVCGMRELLRKAYPREKVSTLGLMGEPIAV